VSAGDSRLTASRPVTIRDRRELPFFQVRLKAVQAIRTEVNGPRRLRTIGFYGLLCQLANEQRHTGDHRRLQFTYDLLAARGGVARRNVKVMLDYLQHAGVTRYERLTDAERGATISILHLLVQEGGWTPISVAMADRLADPRPGGHPLRELGLLIILLEFCAAQRGDLGGVTAEVTRGEIADQAGLTVDRVDQCNHQLQDAGVLSIIRRRSSNGGRHLASLYTIHEAPAATEQGRETEPAAPQNETDRAADENWQGRERELPVPTMGTGRAAEGNSPDEHSALETNQTRPSYGRAGWSLENEIETTPSAIPSEQGRGEGTTDPQERLCEDFLAAWAPVLGDALVQTYRSEEAKWRAAAGRLLERHSVERLHNGFAGMLEDEIVGSRATTLPQFEKVVDQLIVRRHARRQQRSTVGGPRPSAGGWEDARQHLERAIQRHGRDHRDQALTELAAHDPLLVRFVERVRWSTLCDQQIQFAERRYIEMWSEIVREAHPEETAA
jgi:hypothetical protein